MDATWGHRPGTPSAACIQRGDDLEVVLHLPMHRYLADFDDTYRGWLLLGSNPHYVCLGHTLVDYIDLLQLAANTEVAFGFPAADPLGILLPPRRWGAPGGWRTEPRPLLGAHAAVGW